MTTLAQRAISLTDFIGTVAGEAASVSQSASDVATFLNGVKLVSSLVPGLSSVIAVLDIAQPIIQKIAAGAPMVHAALEAGTPIIDAVELHGADILPHVRQLLALALNADPARAETNASASSVDDQETTAFGALIFTPGHTNAEQQREWDRAAQT